MDCLKPFYGQRRHLSCSTCARWVLSKGDFGVYALAVSTSALITSFQDAGAYKLLIQRASEYKTLARPVYQIAFASNCILAIILALLAPWLARFYGAPQLTLLLWVLAAYMPLNTPSMVLQSKLASDMRFKELSTIGAISAILRQAFTVLFALLGLGPLSFVIPVHLCAIFEWIAAWRLVGWLPREGKLTRDIFKDIWVTSQWIILGTLAKSLVMQGDYLVVGKLKTSEILGIYFFAFQLTAGFAMLF